MEEQAKKTATSGQQSAFLHQAKNDCILTIPCFDDVAKMKDALKDSSLGEGAPYMIKAAPAVRAWTEDRAIRSSMGVFRIQFPASKQLSTPSSSQKGYSPFHNEKKDQFRSALFELGPPATQLASMDGADTIVAKTSSQVFMYGKQVGHSGTCQVRQGLPAIMYQISGVSEYVIVDFATLSDFAAKTDQVKKARSGFS